MAPHQDASPLDFVLITECDRRSCFCWYSLGVCLYLCVFNSSFLVSVSSTDEARASLLPSVHSSARALSGFVNPLDMAVLRHTLEALKGKF